MNEEESAMAQRSFDVVALGELPNIFALIGFSLVYVSRSSYKICLD